VSAPVQALWRRLTGPGSPLRRLARRLGLWRLRGVRGALGRMRARRDAVDASADAPGALLVGHPYGVLGVGEYVRASAAAFAAAGIPFHIRNTYDWGEHLAEKHPDFPFWDRLTTGHPHRMNVFHINADEMAEARRHLGDAFFAGRYNIASWHWELSRLPDAWLPALEGIDELWASSRFIRQALAQRARVPVVWMPHPVEVSGGAEPEASDSRLPERSFLFLTFFDFTSFVARKNPLGAIRSFRAAFPPGATAPVGLVVKANGAEARPAEAKAFLALPELRDPRIVVINEVMDRRRLVSLLRRCDCFVSLHRSEGFGRGIAEALLLEKPVIVTGYSGNMDFTSPENACLINYRLVDVGPDEYPHAAGQQWADPDLEQAAEYMRRVVSDPAWAASLARRGRELVRAQHSVEAVGRRYRARLEGLGFV
jgi:glycosyltransferase involved in cell wall biosynthesis